jgi:DNA-binding transcriptional LysR family regulator
MPHSSEEIQLPHARHAVIRHLPYFVIVAQEEHFHRAAERINMTQSALSRRIQGLEEELGVALFDRTMRGVKLTPAGRALYEHAQRVLTDIERAVARIQAVARGEEGLLRIALNEGAARCARVAQGLRAFRHAYPAVQVELHSMLSDDQLAALTNEAIDAGFLYEFERDGPFNQMFNTLFVHEEKMVLALHEGHPLAALKDISLADLRDEKLIWSSRSRGRRIYDRMIAAFRAVDMSPQILLEVISAEITVNLVSSHMGIGFVPQSQIVPEGVFLRPVRDFHVPLHLSLVWRRNNHSSLLKRLVDMAADAAPANNAK